MASGRTALGAAAIALGLAACGGGEPDPDPREYTCAEVWSSSAKKRELAKELLAAMPDDRRAGLVKHRGGREGAEASLMRELGRACDPAFPIDDIAPFELKRKDKPYESFLMYYEVPPLSSLPPASRADGDD